MSENGKQEKKKNKIIILLIVGMVICLSVTTWALFFRQPQTKVVLTPDYAQMETEVNQIPIEGDDNEKLAAEDGGGAVRLTYSTTVTIDLSEKKAKLMFANPGKSTQDMVLQLVAQNDVLAQSGRLTPGNQIAELDLTDIAVEKLVAGGYDGKFVVLFYNPDNDERAIINTEIPVTITVNE